MLNLGRDNVNLFYSMFCKDSLFWSGKKSKFKSILNIRNYRKLFKYLATATVSNIICILYRTVLSMSRRGQRPTWTVEPQFYE